MRKIILFFWLLIFFTLKLFSRSVLALTDPVCSNETVTCFAHITDTHVEDFTNDEKLENAINYFNNVVKPLFVIHTGDTVTSATQANFIRYLNAIAASAVPVYVAPGNHDKAGNFQYFLDNINSRNFSFDCNGYRFIGFDSIAIDDVWLETELQNAPLGKSLVFGHLPISWPSELTHPLLNMSEENRLKISNWLSGRLTLAYLSGHLHEPFVDYNPVKSILDLGGPTMKKSSWRLVCLDNRQVSSLVVSIVQDPLVIITSPEEYLGGLGRGEVGGGIVIRVKTFSSHSISAVTVKIDNGEKLNLANIGDNLWELSVDFSALAFGRHSIIAEATDSENRMVTHQIQIMKVVIGNLDNDALGKVNNDDLDILLDKWGSSGSADLSKDGQVDEKDLTILLANWRP